MSRLKQRKHKEILAAAQEAFLERGYVETSVDEIAKRAGVSKRTLYNHFSTKEELFRSIIDEVAEREASLGIPYDPDADITEQLQQIVDVRLAALADPLKIRLIRLLVSEVLRNPDLSVMANQDMCRHDDALAEWFRRAHDDGKLNVPSPQLSARIFWAGLSGANFWRTLLSDRDALPDDHQEVAEEWIQVFLARYRV